MSEHAMAVTALLPAPAYPVYFEVDHPAEQSRWKAIFRLVLIIPAFLFVLLVQYAAFLALLPMWVAIVFRGRAPRWLFDFQLGFNRFNAGVQAYFSLLTDAYPAFDGQYPVRYDVSYPQRLSRWKVLFWKFFTSIPQWFVVWLLQYAAFAIVTVGWICIVFSKQFPRGLHQFVVGTMRWRERVYAYMISLTDEYPPYSLSADATATTGRALWVSSAIGVLGVGGVTAGVVALIVAILVAAPFGGDEHVVDVSYARLISGELAPGEAVLSADPWDLELVSASDPAEQGAGLFAAQPGYRFVQFSLFLTNRGNEEHYWDAGGIELSDAADDSRPPFLTVVNRMAPPVIIREDDTVSLDIVFEVPLNVQPDELIFDTGFSFFDDKDLFRFE